MNRHDLKLVCVSIAATLVCTLSVNTVLADTPLRDSIKSYGVFKYDNDPSDNQDDIVIDSSDFVKLANEIDTAKNSIGVVGKNLDKLVTVFDRMDEQGKDGKLFGTQIDSTDVLNIENAFANGVGNATASKVLKDYTFTSQYGLNIPGTIESLQASTITPGTKDQTLKAGFYLKGAQTIKGDTNLKAENILSGKSIFGVNGSVIAEVNSSAHTVPKGKTVSTAANILKNTTAWNGTTWVDGSMTNKSNSTTAASTVTEDGSNAKIQIPASGYYDANNSYITVPVETLKKEVSALNSSYVINAVNAKKSGLSSSASMQEIAAYITANWTGGSSIGNISYVRHYHSSVCYSICGGTKYDNGNGHQECNICHAIFDINDRGTCTKNVLKCGYTNGQIIKATITY